MTRQIDDNLILTDSDHVHCRHCSTQVGRADGQFLEQARWREQPAAAAGDSVVRADPRLFVDRDIVLRQAFCPTCFTLLLTEIVPADEPRFRSKTLTSAGPRT